MKPILIWICMLAAYTSPLCAAEPDAIGAGVIVGNPPGVTAKLWYGNRAVDTGITFGHYLTLYGDYLWNIFKVLPQSYGGKLPAYIGVGFQVSPDELGLRVVTGLAYWLPQSPIEMFLDVVNASLALLTFVVTGGLVLLTVRLVPGFHIASFCWALAFALMLSAINAFLRGGGVTVRQTGK